ncbi:hypothetical protein ACQPW3_11290 [Actinosynnema sp. CA-248983]
MRLLAGCRSASDLGDEHGEQRSTDDQFDAGDDLRDRFLSHHL